MILKVKPYFWPKMSFPNWFIRESDSVRIRNKYFPCPRNSKNYRIPGMVPLANTIQGSCTRRKKSKRI